jgi:tetratricopeptide (TPR) repeat protein
MQVRALALKGLNRLDEAAVAFDAACNRSPAPAAVIADRAWFAAEMGHRHWAVDELKRAIDLAPDLAAARYYHAYFARLKNGSPYLLRLEAMANNEDVPHRDRIAASFAVGKTHLDQDRDAAAFAWLRRANRLKRSAVDYDEAREAALIDAIIQAYPGALATSGTAGERAIFVFGMPRSGTTLVEQILATHSAVHGAGEPTCLRDIAGALGYPHSIAEQSEPALVETGSRYLATVGSGVPPDKRIVDKMPSNFLYAGLIPAILPGARMIHCRRDPLDTCFSCYSLLFGEGQEYSYDLGELGRYYRLYSRLMAYWRKVLPPDQFIEVDYESLIAEPETQIRRLLEFCDLPWEEACLSPHKTGRRVGSASLDQVRSPIYKTSVGRARRFLPFLSELVEALHS